MANRVDLNQLRKVMLGNQESNVPVPTEPARKVYVAPDGAIRLGTETSASETPRMAEVHQGTFYAYQVDLNLVRDRLLNELPLPTHAALKVYVSRDGEVLLGTAIHLADARRLSEVNRGTFFAYDALRHARDYVTASTKMPANTKAVDVGGISGYSYSIVCAVGNPYSFFAYFDGVSYQVSLVSPSLEGQYGPHDAHLYSDGRLCLCEGGLGMPTLESAYAKSVVWATGFSFVRQGHTFPFSNNN